MRRWAIRFLSRAHLAAYRLSRGRVLGSVAGMPVLLAHHHRSAVGQGAHDAAHVLSYATDLVVVASNGGADRPPDWALNLQQTPRAVVEIGTDKMAVTARTASPQERERPWIVITATHAGYARYQGMNDATDPARPSHTLPRGVPTPLAAMLAMGPGRGHVAA